MIFSLASSTSSIVCVDLTIADRKNIQMATLDRFSSDMISSLQNHTEQIEHAVKTLCKSLKGRNAGGEEVESMAHASCVDIPDDSDGSDASSDDRDGVV